VIPFVILTVLALAFGAIMVFFLKPKTNAGLRFVLSSLIFWLATALWRLPPSAFSLQFFVGCAVGWGLVYWIASKRYGQT
jgi:hypothetical protein